MIIVKKIITITDKLLKFNLKYEKIIITKPIIALIEFDLSPVKIIDIKNKIKKINITTLVKLSK